MNIEISRTHLTENYIEAEILPGTSITAAVTDAIQLAKDKNRAVQFEFNGAVARVTGSDKVAAVVTAIQAQMESNRQAYLQSDAYKKSEARRQEMLKQDQIKIDALLIRLPTINGHQQWVDWVGQFAAVNDNMHLKYPKTEISSYMRAAGYVRSECIGHPEVSTNYEVAVRWIMGQAIDHLLSDMPIHPGLSNYAQQLAARQLEAERKALK